MTAQRFVYAPALIQFDGTNAAEVLTYITDVNDGNGNPCAAVAEPNASGIFIHWPCAEGFTGPFQINTGDWIAPTMQIITNAEILAAYAPLADVQNLG